MTGEPRQRVERVPGARRARLTPAPGSLPGSVEADGADAEASVAPAGDRAAASGPNDERMRQDVPPHY